MPYQDQSIWGGVFAEKYYAVEHVLQIESNRVNNLLRLRKEEYRTRSTDINSCSIYSIFYTPRLGWEGKDIGFVVMRGET